VFDVGYFSGAFADRVREFSTKHDDAHLRLSVVILSGERLDALELRASQSGASLSTRDDRLLFLPYEQIAYLDLAVLTDRRVPGFELSIDSQ